MGLQMTSTDQTLNIATLMGSPRQANSKSAGTSSVAEKDANSLKDNSFSTVLQDQQQTHKDSSAGHKGADGASSSSVAVPDAEATRSSVTVLAADHSGKALPSEGGALPLLTESAEVTEDSTASFTMSGIGAEALSQSVDGVDISVVTAQQATGSELSTPIADTDVEGGVILATGQLQSMETGTPVAIQSMGRGVGGGIQTEMSSAQGTMTSTIPVPSGAPTVLAANGTEDLRLMGGPVTVQGTTPAAEGSYSASLIAGSNPVAGLAATQSANTLMPAGNKSLLAGGEFSIAAGEWLSGNVESLSRGEGSTQQPDLDLETLLPNSQVMRRDMAAPATNATYQTAVPVEVGKPGWADGVIDKVMWMSAQNASKAEIALDPPELGPLQVRVSTQGDQTTISFNSAHGTVRDALDQSLPRLREMMENQGFSHVDVDVSGEDRQYYAQGEQGESTDSRGTSASADSVSGNGDELTDSSPVGRVTSELPGLVDQYV